MPGITTPVKFDINNQLIAAGGTLDALTGWQYETPDTDCMVELLERATALGLISVFTSAGNTIKQDNGVQAGGTAAVTPARLTTEPMTGKAPRGQKLRLFVRNPTGGGITFDGTVILTPLRGGSGGGRSAPRRRSPFRRRRR